MNGDYLHGRGSQFQTTNKFLRQTYSQEFIEGLDEPFPATVKTQVLFDAPKTIVNKVTSPDVGMMYSANPYQGCEHGCVYCYARNSHEYWGFSAGLDFESKIIVKPNAAELLERHINAASWNPVPISLSGNTDCYQPLEREHRLTRKMLEVFVRYRHPVSIITKNSLILRDLDLLEDLAAEKLVAVYISITTLDEDLRRKLEPRTASSMKRLKTIEGLSQRNIPTAVMAAPIIPGLNQHEIPAILKASAEAGAISAGMTVVRLNGAVSHLFEDWLLKNYPDRSNKVWNQIQELHEGHVNDSEFGRRMRGSGQFAEAIHQTFRMAKRRHFGTTKMPALNLTAFRKGGNYSLF